MRFSGSGGGHHQQQYLSSSSELILPKFQTAYSNIEDRRKRRILTFDIEKINSCISLSAEDCICIVGERKHTNAILMRLCVRALLKLRKEQSELLEDSEKKVIFIDAGGGKSSDIYQCVNFARQYYGIDIKKVLQSILVTRAFTIYQLADLLIYQLPRIIQQLLEAKVIVVIADLLDLFTQDPSIDQDEAIYLIKEIINSIKKTLDNTLVVVSFQSNDHHRKSYAYDKILLPRFDKRIEIINNSDSKINLLDVKVYSNKYTKNCSRSLVLEERDLLIISAPK
jgi:hypothetical protein